MTDNPHYVTPEEAIEKGCVMSMARQNPHFIYQTCLGSVCMAWRWDKDAPMRYKGDGNPQPTDQAKGYCGMVRS